MTCGQNMDVLKDSGKFPCAVCRKGVGSNSIYCSGCSHWVHKKCSGIKGRLTADPQYKCPRCLGQARPIDGRPVHEVSAGEDVLEVVASFCYLGDMLSAGGGCELAAINRVNVGWGKFRGLLPILSSRHLPPKTRGRIYDTCVRSAMLYASETWARTAAVTNRFRRNERAMVRKICRVQPLDEVETDDLLEKLGITGIEKGLRIRRLRWYGHVHRAQGWTNHVRDLHVEPLVKLPGRPKKTWKEGAENDKTACGMSNIDPLDRDAWSAGLKRFQTGAYPAARDPRSSII